MTPIKPTLRTTHPKNIDFLVCVTALLPLMNDINGYTTYLP